MKIRVFILLLLFLDACAREPGPDGAALTGTASPTAAPQPGEFATQLLQTSAVLQTTTQTAWQTATLIAAVPQPTAQNPQICSPLDGVPLEQVPGKIVNPYHPPPPGSDDPHEGIDLAELLPGGSIAVAGLPVHLVLAGRVAGVIADRFPYGNAILVETPLEGLPPQWLSQFQLPTPGPALPPHSALTCPPAPTPSWNREKRSLYLVYAHLAQPVEFQLDDKLTCGQQIGAIGSSGNALNPHLHLEARTGPSGARFSSMAHYDNTATLEEMANYCIWRVSGLFQLIDPVRLLSPAKP